MPDSERSPGPHCLQFRPRTFTRRSRTPWRRRSPLGEAVTARDELVRRAVNLGHRARLLGVQHVVTDRDGHRQRIALDTQPAPAHRHHLAL
eukprot:2001154-Prymnesium_polylepis.1